MNHLKASLLLGIGCLWASWNIFASESLLVKSSQIQERKYVFATLVAEDITQARTRMSGTIDGLSKDEGQLVKRGDVIAFVVDEKQPLEIAAVQASLKSLSAELSLANIELERIQILQKSGVATKSELDQIQSRVQVLQNNLASLEAQKQVLLERFSERQILAPINGRILKIHVTNGRVVQPGENIADIAAERYLLRLELPERHASYLKKNQSVDIYLNDSQPSTAQIVQIYPLIERGRVKADIALESIDSYFVGQRIKVAIPLYEVDTIKIPKRFVQKRYGLNFVRLKDNHDIVIQVGQDFGDDIEVLSGLNVNDEIMLP